MAGLSAPAEVLCSAKASFISMSATSSSVSPRKLRASPTFQPAACSRLRLLAFMVIAPFFTRARPHPARRSYAVNPPSMLRLAPVTNPASGPASHATIAAISSASA